MSGTGGGSNNIAAWAFIRTTLGGRTASKSAEQAVLDDEELRAVEYAEMGMPLPPPHVALLDAPRRGRLARLLGRR